MTTTADVLEFLGSLLASVFGITGAFCWLRWGYAGVKLLWSKRMVIDEVVEEELAAVLRGVRHEG